jgi:hypothetical protein
MNPERTFTGSIQEYRQILLGAGISEAAAEEFEQRLKIDQCDYEARRLLLGYYSEHARSSSQQQCYADHLIWLAEHAPASFTAGMLIMRLNSAQLGRVRNCWLRQVRLSHGDVAVINNAAQFCMPWSLDDAETLWKKAQSLEPKNAMWSYKLSGVYRMRARNCSSMRTATTLAKKSSAQFEMTLALSRHYAKATSGFLTPAILDSALTEYGELALEFGLFSTARDYGLKLLTRVRKRTVTWGDQYCNRLIEKAHALLFKAYTGLGKPHLAKRYHCGGPE